MSSSRSDRPVRFALWLLCLAAAAAAQGPPKYHEVSARRVEGQFGESALSPDGKVVLYVNHETLYRLELETGSAKQMFPALDTARSPAYSSDGKWIYFNVNAAGKPGQRDVYRLDVERGGTQRVLEGACGTKPSPDGKYLAFFRGCLSPAAVLAVARADGSEERILHKVDGYRQEVTWSPDGEKLLVHSWRATRIVAVSRHTGAMEDFIVERRNWVEGLAWPVGGAGVLALRGSAGVYRPAQIWQYSVPGTAWTQLTHDEEGFRNLIGATPDGSKLAAVRAIDNGSFWEGMMDAIGAGVDRPNRWTYELVLLKKD